VKDPAIKKNLNDINVATSWVMLESNTKVTTHNEIIEISAIKTITTVIATIIMFLSMHVFLEAC